MHAMSAHFDRSRSESSSTALIFGNESERFFVVKMVLHQDPVAASNEKYSGDWQNQDNRTADGPTLLESLT